MAQERCDWRGCGNKAYREVDYFTSVSLRQRVAKRLASMTLEESSKYVQQLVKTREISWSFLCRKHFEEEREMRGE